jgi:hypothetical protein
MPLSKIVLIPLSAIIQLKYIMESVGFVEVIALSGGTDLAAGH